MEPTCAIQASRAPRGYRAGYPRPSHPPVASLTRLAPPQRSTAGSFRYPLRDPAIPPVPQAGPPPRPLLDPFRHPPAPSLPWGPRHPPHRFKDPALRKQVLRALNNNRTRVRIRRPSLHGRRLSAVLHRAGTPRFHRVRTPSLPRAGNASPAKTPSPAKTLAGTPSLLSAGIPHEIRGGLPRVVPTRYQRVCRTRCPAHAPAQFSKTAKGTTRPQKPLKGS